MKTRFFPSHFYLITRNVFLMVGNFGLIRSLDQSVDGKLHNVHRRSPWWNAILDFTPCESRHLKFWLRTDAVNVCAQKRHLMFAIHANLRAYAPKNKHGVQKIFLGKSLAIHFEYVFIERKLLVYRVNACRAVQQQHEAKHETHTYLLEFSTLFCCFVSSIFCYWLHR